jgi:hypothetical protein
VLSPYLADAIDPVIDIPGAVTAVRGRAPLNLRELVHYRGADLPHAGLAWRAGHELELAEPDLRLGEIA